jgi:hypothetical protein
MAGKSIYPSIPAPGSDSASLLATVAALRQTVTLVIMNAQNPNPNYSPSAASQVFATKADLAASGVVGPTGATGAPGPPGPGIAEAPSDINTYGRQALTWQPVLAAQGAVFITLPVNATNDANAATAGVVVGGIYRNGSQLMVRVA